MSIYYVYTLKLQTFCWCMFMYKRVYLLHECVGTFSEQVLNKSIVLFYPLSSDTAFILQ